MTLSPQAIQNLETAYRKDLPFTLRRTPKGIVEVDNSSISDKYVFWRGRQVSQSREERLTIFTEILKRHQLHETPEKADNDPILLLASKFQRQEASSDQRLLKLLWSHRLAIPVEAFDKEVNKGFLPWAKRAHLNRYLVGNKHRYKKNGRIETEPGKLQYAWRTGEIRILCEPDLVAQAGGAIRTDGYYAWKTIRSLVESWDRPERHYYYKYEEGQIRPVSQGLHLMDRTKFTKLFPTEYNPEYEVGTVHHERCAWVQNTIRMLGPHGFFKVWRGPYGYIPGFFRPELKDLPVHKIFAAVGRCKGTLHVRDWCMETRQTLDKDGGLINGISSIIYRSTKDQEDRHLRTVEQQQQNPNQQTISTVENCIKYTNQFDEANGVFIPYTLTTRILLYHELKGRIAPVANRWVSDQIMAVAGRAFFHLENCVNTTTGLIPKPVRWLLSETVSIPCGLLVNIIFGLWGGGQYVDSDLIEHDPDYKPLFGSFWDFLNYRKLLRFPHPFIEAWVMKQLIEDWRGEGSMEPPGAEFLAWMTREHPEVDISRALARAKQAIESD